MFPHCFFSRKKGENGKSRRKYHSCASFFSWWWKWWDELRVGQKSELQLFFFCKLRKKSFELMVAVIFVSLTHERMVHVMCYDIVKSKLARRNICTYVIIWKLKLASFSSHSRLFYWPFYALSTFGAVVWRQVASLLASGKLLQNCFNFSVYTFCTCEIEGKILSEMEDYVIKR